MKFKLLLLAISMVVCSSVMAQSHPFFGPVEKPVTQSFMIGADGNVHMMGLIVPVKPMNVIRPMISPIMHTVPGNILATGAGAGLQHLTFNTTTNKWYCVYSFSLVGWVSFSTDPATPSSTLGYGPMVGLINNTIVVGGFINQNELTKKTQVLFAVGFAISLNN